MLTTLDSYTRANKEPWLAASLSWLLPGTGHFYAGAYGYGAFFIVITGFLHVFWLVSLISTRTSIILSMLLNLCSLIVLPVYASLDAFRISKRGNNEDFERERTLSKDPWMAVFLNLVLLGVGHFYIRSWIIGLLFLFVFFLLRFISMRIIYVLIFVLVLRALAFAHVYIAQPLHRGKPKQPLIFFIVLFLFLSCLKNFLLPQIEKKFFVQFYGPLIGTSMAPIMPEGSHAIVDRFTYRWGSPLVGDIVMFTSPKDAYSNFEIPACKRIVAVGGETVQILNRVVYVDGKERKVSSSALSQEYPGSSPPIDLLGRDNPYLAYGVEVPYCVPEGKYFLLGDNHRYSVDSRCYGAIPREKIIGKVIKIYWPPASIGIVH